MNKMKFYKVFLSICLILTFSNAECFAEETNAEFKIQKIAEGVYQHISYKVVQPWGLVGSNGLVVVNHKKAFIIDTPWSAADTEKLVTWIEQQGFILQGSVSTHFHDDRTAGIEFLNSKSIPTYASSLTNELLKNKNVAQATHPFSKNDLWLEKGTIEIYYPGAAHTRDNMVVWLPKQKILFGGCMIRSSYARDMGNTADGDLKAWPDSVKKLQQKFKSAKIVVPGHGGVGDITLLQHTRDLAIAATTQTATPIPTEHTD